jgi:hypothetical protein
LKKTGDVTVRPVAAATEVRAAAEVKPLLAAVLPKKAVGKPLIALSDEEFGKY